MDPDTNMQSDVNADEYIRLAYQTALDDIRFFKRQQWIVTNYTVLIYGAIIAVARMISKVAGLPWFMYIPCVIALFSIILVFQLQNSTQNARDRKVEALEAIDPKKNNKKLRDMLDGKPLGQCMLFLDKYSVLILLAFVIIGGGSLTVWVLSILQCS
jgi:hypothetical protein